MRIRTWAALALAVVTMVTAPIVAAGPDQQRPEPKWALSWEAALQESKERNVPIYLAYHQDG